MYNRILATLDGSQLSEGILPYARLFAKTLKVPAELLHVIDPETLVPTTVERGRYHELLAAERGKNDDYLRKVATSFSDASTVDCTVEVGNPAEVIINRAEAHPNTLIAMATHGRSGLGRWLLGSVADKVLHATVDHVLLVRATEQIKTSESAFLKSILVPLDGSELAESVLPWVVELARGMNLQIALLRVFGLPIGYYAEGYWADGLVWELVRDEAKDYLEEKVKQIEKEGLSGVTPILTGGFAAEQIIDLAQKTPQTLVAMCTHGRTGMGRWVLGSVTERVVRHSGDPVLVIRAPSESGHAPS